MAGELPLGEVVYFDVITTSPTTLAAADADSAPSFEVFEEATDTDIGVGTTMTKRTSKTGDYRGSFTASSGNGFELGKWYIVVVSATVVGVAGKCVAMHFRIVETESIAGVRTADLSAIAGDATSASNLSKSAKTMLTGTVTTGASTTSVPTSAFSGTVNVADQFKDRVIIFLFGSTTTGLRTVAKFITASTNSATPILTVDTLPATPQSGDTFIIV